MSQENVEIIERVIAAGSRGDFDAVLALHHPDCRDGRKGGVRCSEPGAPVRHARFSSGARVSVLIVDAPALSANAEAGSRTKASLRRLRAAARQARAKTHCPRSATCQGDGDPVGAAHVLGRSTELKGVPGSWHVYALGEEPAQRVELESAAR